jgi:hypothetical protein
MKANGLIVTLVLGILAAVPASAFPSGSHSQNYYNYLSRVRGTAGQAKPEMQVAVMAKSPAQPVTYSPWYGSAPRSRATHGR